MKKIIPILLISLGFSVTSCELDRVPETSFSDASFWNTEKDLKEACNYFYSQLPGISTKDNISDDTFGSGPNSISDGSRIVPNSSGDWSNPYSLIRAANNVLEKSAKMKLDPTILCKYRAEAKFFRAWSYFDLVKKYGDVPLILKTLDINSPELTMARTPRSVVVDSIYADLDYAAKYLVEYSKLGKENYGRLTQSAAFAFKSRVALYVGTHQKFHGYGDSNAHLKIAIEAAEKVMAAGHKLFTAKGASSYYSLFRYDGEGYSNSENILVKVYGQNKANNILSHNFSRNLEQGVISATRSLVESYLCTDGLPLDKSPLAEKIEVNSKSIFANKDPRLNATIYKSGDGNWLASAGSIYSPTIAFIKTGFACKKYADQNDWIEQVSFIDNVIIRYAEVLLNYAEAKFELNGVITDEELDKSINLIRARVGMPRLTNAFADANGLDMRSEIRRERRVELALEGFRYDDIIRWKIAEQVLPQAVLGAKYFKDEYVNVANPNLTSEGFFVVQTKEKRTFRTDRDYLYPIPIREMALTNGVITQNPNW